MKSVVRDSVSVTQPSTLMLPLEPHNKRAEPTRSE